MMVDWNQIIYDPENEMLRKFDFIAKKRFPDENIALEATTFILGKMAANNWYRLRDYNGRAKPSTYLYTVFLNALEDFSKSKYGYIQPKKWLKDLGSFWIKVWKLLCLERNPPEYIKVLMGQGNKQKESEILTFIKLTKAKEPNCGAQTGVTTIGGTAGDSHDEIANKEVGDGPSITEGIAVEDLEELLETIAMLTGLISQISSTNQLNQKLQEFGLKLNINPNEKLILKMMYLDGMNITNTAKNLNITRHKTKKIHDHILNKIKTILKQIGIDGDDLFYD